MSDKSMDKFWAASFYLRVVLQDGTSMLIIEADASYMNSNVHQSLDQRLCRRFLSDISRCIEAIMAASISQP